VAGLEEPPPLRAPAHRSGQQVLPGRGPLEMHHQQAYQHQHTPPRQYPQQPQPPRQQMQGAISSFALAQALAAEQAASEYESPGEESEQLAKLCIKLQVRRAAGSSAADGWAGTCCCSTPPRPCVHFWPLAAAGRRRPCPRLPRRGLDQRPRRLRPHRAPALKTCQRRCCSAWRA
jgi:hypothetical protein